jgi:hypothetical protein
VGCTTSTFFDGTENARFSGQGSIFKIADLDTVDDDIDFFMPTPPNVLDNPKAIQL